MLQYQVQTNLVITGKVDYLMKNYLEMSSIWIRDENEASPKRIICDLELPNKSVVLLNDGRQHQTK